MQVYNSVSFRTKAILTILLPLVVILIMLSWIGYQYAYSIIEHELNEQMAFQMQAIIQSFNTELNVHKTIGETLARIAEKSGEKISKPQYAAILQNIITTNPHTLGAGIWYEPFRYKDNIKYFGPYVYKDKDKFIYTEAYEDPQYDFHNHNWYKMAVHTDKPVVWSNPYYDEHTKITMITASMPFYDENKRLKGVVTSDMDLIELQNTISNTKVGEKGWAFLLDSNGTYMADRDNNKVMKVKMVDDPNPAVAKLGKEIITNKNGVSSYHKGDEIYRVYYAELPETGWILGLTIPESELYVKLHALLFKQSIIAGIAIILVLMVIIIYTRFITQTINKRRFAEEQLIQKNKELEELNAELLNAQAQVIQQEKMASIGQLAAGVAHEINNPMSFMASNLKTLHGYIDKIVGIMIDQEKMIGEVSEKQDIEHVLGIFSRIKEANRDPKTKFIINDMQDLIKETLDGADRIKNIVLSLRNFARVEKNNIIANINEGIESTLNIVWNEIKYKAKLTKELGDIPLTKCNLGQLNQVFMNMLVNASQAIDSEGEIYIRTWTAKDNIYISIADTGCGISPEIMNKIFDPFFTTKEAGKGTGLGLNISYNIIKKHGGEIQVESEVGRGTTFTIVIPIVTE